MRDVALLLPADGRQSGTPGADHLIFLLVATTVFLSPYNVLRHSSVYFTAADFLILLNYFLLLTIRRLPATPFGNLTPVWYVGFLAIGFGLLIGAIANQRLVAGSTVISQYAYAMVILPWVLCGWTYVQTRRLLLIWIISIVVVMLQGIYVVEFMSDPPRSLVTGSGRLSGVLERENALAVIGAMAIVVTMYLSAEAVLSRLWTLLFLAILLYGIILTASNTGLLALAAGVTTFSLLQRSRRHYGTMALLCILILTPLLVGGAELLPDSFMRRVGSALTSGDLEQAGTFEDRMQLAHEGWRVSADHVFVGLGPDGFRVTSNGPPVHNTYILLLVEGGLLSLVGMCMIIGTIALRGATLLLAANTRNLGAMVMTICLQFALVLNTLAHVYARFWYVPLILVLALGLSPQQSSLAGPAPGGKRY